MRSLRSVWRQFWDNAPRQLRITSAGRIVLGIAVATGFAAINTGNNLLFLGWGMMLSAILVSGVLSEAVLRRVEASIGAPEEARVGAVAHLPMVVRNQSLNVPLLGVELAAVAAAPAGGSSLELAGPFCLRIGPTDALEGDLRWTPQQRGRHTLTTVIAKTSYPFGFFEKRRRFRPVLPLAFDVAPARVPVESLRLTLHSQLGVAAAAHRGRGDEFFSLRPFQQGDDPRRVAWRRSARQDRMMVVETEALTARAVLLQLVATSPSAASEYAIAVTASLAEALLHDGLRVGVLAPGTYVPTDSGPGQRRLVLTALGRMTFGESLPKTRAEGAVRVAIALEGQAAPPGTDEILWVPWS